ncbi:hypothetical protein LOK49_LG08G00656 [Camellia lanceoleosa]|uniref:Uncharacterized protein n=1 Tax=Camellia lanceoleosa TaxID=1840588 RepID=A0ACC0GUC1_9ERIC|nr:hypothetical protein LOK49_LG08G00656 [Camellia lanceoleosa]
MQDERVKKLEHMLMTFEGRVNQEAVTKAVKDEGYVEATVAYDEQFPKLENLLFEEGPLAALLAIAILEGSTLMKKISYSRSKALPLCPQHWAQVNTSRYDESWGINLPTSRSAKVLTDQRLFHIALILPPPAPVVAAETSEEAQEQELVAPLLWDELEPPVVKPEQVQKNILIPVES